MNFKNIFFAAAAAMALTACSSDDEQSFVSQFPEDGVMRFTTNLVDPTVATTRASITSGDVNTAGQQFQVKIVNPSPTYSYFNTVQYDGAEWTPTDRMLWQNDTQSITVTAAYQQGKTFTDSEFLNGANLSVAADQRTVSNVRIYSQFSGIEDSNPTGSTTEIQPYVQGEGGYETTYTALVVPGGGDGGADFIQLSDAEGSTLLVKGIPRMEAGYSYTFNLTVGKNKIEVASVTVTDWTNDGSGVYGECTVTVTDLSAYYSKMVECGCGNLDGKCVNGAAQAFTGQVLSASQAIALAKAKAAETNSNCAVFYGMSSFAKNDGSTGSASFYYDAANKGLSGYRGYYVSK